ncbi:hypothetical protein EV121DRAFT_214523 [Schizophyllum commune]
MPRLKSINIGASTCRFLYDLRMPHLESITTESTMDAFISLLHFFTEGGGYPHIIRDLHLLHFHSNSLCYSDTNVQVLQRLLDLLRKVEHLRTLAVDISSGTHMHLDDPVPAEVVIGMVVSEGLLPSLTEITIHTRYSPSSATLRPLVREMIRARAAIRTIDGTDVAALERVTTDFEYASESDSEQENDE